MEQTLQPANPLMAKIKLPGRIFRLPSGGYLYKNGELSDSCKDGEVHVRPMSALSEIKIKNPDMLFSGQAVREILAECVEEIKKPMELFGRDIDALMCFLRVVTYGPKFRIEADHGCKDSKSNGYEIDIENIIQNIRQLDPTTIGLRYEVKLPNEQVVTLDPIRFKTVVELMQSNNKDLPTSEDIQMNMINNLLNMINNIDGHSDKELIREWVQAAPATYISAIANALDSSNEWGPKFEQEVECRDCHEKMTIELPLNPVNFFSE
jgi:hypothetical protein